MDERKSNINALAGLDMSEEKDDRVDFEFVRDAIENQDQEKMKIVAKDFIRWMKESDEHNGLYELMVATTGKSEEEIDAFIFEQVVAKAADQESVQKALDKGKKAIATDKELRKGLGQNMEGLISDEFSKQEEPTFEDFKNWEKKQKFQEDNQ